jgi:polyisoprenoid-binding protein YceI
MVKKFFVFVVMVGLVYGFGMGMNEYEADIAHSSLSFKISHMVVSKVRGHFNDFSVTIKEDPNDITKSSVAVVIKTASIDTDNEKRDNHLRSADFFDAEKYPEITFQSSRIGKKGDAYTVVGILNMHGVSKEITIPFEITGKMKDPWGNTRAGIEASTQLDRKDYGLNWNKTLDKGGLMVGNEVKIEILLEMVSKKQ